MCVDFNLENYFLVYLEISTSNIYMALVRAQSLEFFHVFTPGSPTSALLIFGDR